MLPIGIDLKLGGANDEPTEELDSGVGYAWAEREGFPVNVGSPVEVKTGFENEPVKDSWEYVGFGRVIQDTEPPGRENELVNVGTGWELGISSARLKTEDGGWGGRENEPTGLLKLLMRDSVGLVWDLWVKIKVGEPIDSVKES